MTNKILKFKDLFACNFPSFLQVFKRGFLQKITISMFRESRLKPGKLLNLTGHIGKNKAVFNTIVLIFSEQHSFKLRAISLTRPV